MRFGPSFCKCDVYDYVLQQKCHRIILCSFLMLLYCTSSACLAGRRCVNVMSIKTELRYIIYAFEIYIREMTAPPPSLRPQSNLLTKVK